MKFITLGNLRIFSFTTTASIFILMLLGSYTSSIGAGLACPDWPLCPNITSYPIFIEFLHRTWSMVTLLFILITLFIALKLKGNGYEGIKKSTYALITVFLAQVFWGALNIFLTLNPIIVTVHQGLATLTFGLALILTLQAYQRR
ncbi:MAG: COX15/CtaA family protein [Nitrososphaerales archaeon]